jgi:hypothetical protein
MKFLPFTFKIKCVDGCNFMELKRLESGAWRAWLIRSVLGGCFCFLKIVSLVHYILEGSDIGSKIFFEVLIVNIFTYGFVFHINAIMYGEAVEDFFNQFMRFNLQLSKHKHYTLQSDFV